MQIIICGIPTHNDIQIYFVILLVKKLTVQIVQITNSSKIKKSHCDKCLQQLATANMHNEKHGKCTHQKQRNCTQQAAKANSH